jgi:hypothetical protein
MADGTELPDDTLGGGITIRPGQGVDAVSVNVPGMPEFETGPDQLRDWLREHDLVREPHVWSDIERQINEALMHPRPPRGNHPGDGSYEWDDYRADRSGMTDPESERVDEMQSEDWTRMLNAWEQFHQQIQDLHSIAGGDAEEIIRQVGHTITALNMVENSDWAQPYLGEFGEWEGLSTEGLTPESVHAAAAAIVQAGELLHGQWQHTVSAGNYDYHSLLQAQHEFVQQCENARKGMVF